jgi:hypothetical protein
MRGKGKKNGDFSRTPACTSVRLYSIYVIAKHVRQEAFLMNLDATGFIIIFLMFTSFVLGSLYVRERLKNSAK